MSDNMVKSSSFNNCKGSDEKIFHSEQEIINPTLLIKAEFETHSKFLKFIGLKKVLPITHNIGVKLFFQNLYDEEIGTTYDVDFYIKYPDGKQFRPWKINLPNLKNKGDCVYAETKTLFKPEVPGTHHLIIKKIDTVQYADLHGVTDRPYKQIAGDWIGSFHIYSEIEYRFYLIAVAALVVSFLSLIISVLVGICS